LQVIVPAPMLALAPDGGVAQVRQVIGLGAGHQVGLLGLDEVADLDVFVENRLGPQVGEGPTSARAPIVASLATVYGFR
jgi:hypothetical protein